MKINEIITEEITKVIQNFDPNDPDNYEGMSFQRTRADGVAREVPHGSSMHNHLYRQVTGKEPPTSPAVTNMTNTMADMIKKQPSVRGTSINVPEPKYPQDTIKSPIKTIDDPDDPELGEAANAAQQAAIAINMKKNHKKPKSKNMAEATGDQKFDSIMGRMTAEPKYPDKEMPPTSIPELIQWAQENRKPYHGYFAQWAQRNKFTNVNDALEWFGDNVDPSNPWGPKDRENVFGRPAAEELQDAAKHDPKAAELMKVYRCYEEIVFDWPDDYRQMNMSEDLAEEFDLIESIIERLAEHNGVDAEVIWEDLETLTEDELYAFAVTSEPIMESQGVAEGAELKQAKRKYNQAAKDANADQVGAGKKIDTMKKSLRQKDLGKEQGVAESEAWQKANNRDKTDGMSQKSVNVYRREHPGSKLKTAVTTKPSKLKKGSKASKRRKSYCSRSRGQMKMHSISCAKTPDKAICKARRRWNC